jgi:hypothetical protein
MAYQLKMHTSAVVLLHLLLLRIRLAQCDPHAQHEALAFNRL